MPTSPESEQQTPGQSEEVPEAEATADEATADTVDEQSSPEAQVAALQEQLAETENRYRRAIADLDNYRKRMQHEGDRRAAQARDAQLLEWLDALDSVERALRMQPDDEGLIAVLEQMETILARHGVERIARVGEPFDPSRHEAVATYPSTDVPDRAVLDVVRSGFGTRDGDVLRSAQVAVAMRSVDES